MCLARRALRKKAPRGYPAACPSLLLLSMNSIVLPSESTALYKYIQVPFTLTYVSSTRQEELVIFNFAVHRFSRIGGSHAPQAQR